MRKCKQAQWIYWENSWMFAYVCSNCSYGEYDGRYCNQVRYDVCPKCKADMRGSEK